MDLRKFFLGRGEFKSPTQIIQAVSESPDFDTRSESIDNAEPVLIFQTSRQQTWIVATAARLYCVLDDLRRSISPVRWSISKGNLVADRKVTVKISARDSNDRVGLLDIGGRRNWLYSKKLFTSKSIEEEVQDLIRRRMVP